MGKYPKGSVGEFREEVKPHWTGTVAFSIAIGVVAGMNPGIVRGLIAGATAFAAAFYFNLVIELSSWKAREIKDLLNGRQEGKAGAGE